MTTLPADLEPRVRAYLAALLPASEQGAALGELERRIDGDADPPAIFSAAHEVVSAHARVRPDVEADVLVNEAGLPVDEAARILGLDADEVREALELAAEIATELDTAAGGEPDTIERPDVAAEADAREPLAEPGEPLVATSDEDEDTRPARVLVFDDAAEPDPAESTTLAPPQPVTRRRRVVLVAALAAIAVLLAVVLTEPDGGPPLDASNLPISITAATLTSGVDASGQPQEPQRRFEPGEPVVLWFAYELHTDEPPRLQFVLVRDGIAIDVGNAAPIPTGTDHSVALPPNLVAQADTYRLEVRLGEQVLLRRDFAVGT